MSLQEEGDNQGLCNGNMKGGGGGGGCLHMYMGYFGIIEDIPPSLVVLDLIRAKARQAISETSTVRHRHHVQSLDRGIRRGL